ncbi:MAG: putative glycosyltransferase (TIGR04348 family) [Chlamydiales bacterium]
MKVAIIHPARPGIQAGNRVTAERWAGILRHLGCDTHVDGEWSGIPCDVLVALHAGKSEPSIRRFREAHPDRPLIVAGTGTDIYGGAQPAAEVRAGLEFASHIVVLQPNALKALPADVRGKARVVYQSVRVPAQTELPDPERFDVALVANLRPIKDPLRTASAARLLPASSRLQVFHAGSVLEADLGLEADAEAARNPRYTFLGTLDHVATLDRIARSHLLVNTSFGEGGANVISEALALGVPLVCSDIPGSTGLLGDDYPGLFPAGDESILADLLWRAESDPSFLSRLREHGASRAWITEPALELQSWRALLFPGSREESAPGP